MADAIAKQLSDLSLMNDKMRVLLECPVCLDTCTTPIFMCGGGHPVCSRCQPRLTQCPTCRMPGQPTTRCRFMEQISALVKVPCENKVEGCREVLDREEMVKHWETCGKEHSYRCIICDNFFCNRRVLVKHVQAMHPRDYVKGSADVSFTATWFKGFWWESCKLISAHDNHFFVGVSRDSATYYNFFAGCVGSPAGEDLNNFKCKFTYFSTDGSVQHDTWIPVTLYSCDIVSHVFMNAGLMEHFISEGGKFVCTAEIVKQ